MANGHGGRRPNSGRPRVTLAGLVASRTFNPESFTHRKLLLIEEISPAEPSYRRLWSIQEAYRRYSGVGPDAVFLARSFASAVRDDPDGTEA